MVNFCAVCAYYTRIDIVREHLEDTLRICVVSAMGLYTLRASNYSAIQKLKPWLQTQDISMKWELKWEDSYVFYFLKGNLNVKVSLFQIHFQTFQMMKVIDVF
jgi:hypothetical protein